MELFYLFGMQFLSKFFKKFHQSSKKSVKLQKIYTREDGKKQAKIVIYFYCTEIVKKVIKKPWRGKVLSTVSLVTL